MWRHKSDLTSLTLLITVYTGGARSTAFFTPSASRIYTGVQSSQCHSEMVRNYRVFTRPGCWQDGVNQNEPLFAKNECQYVEIWWMKSQKSLAIVYSIRDVSDDISTFRTSIKIRLCPGWAQGSWLSNAAKTITIRHLVSEIIVTLWEIISSRHFIRKKAVLKAVQLGARCVLVVQY